MTHAPIATFAFHSSVTPTLPPGLVSPPKPKAAVELPDPANSDLAVAKSEVSAHDVPFHDSVAAEYTVESGVLPPKPISAELRPCYL